MKRWSSGCCYCCSQRPRALAHEPSRSLSRSTWTAPSVARPLRCFAPRSRGRRGARRERRFRDHLGRGRRRAAPRSSRYALPRLAHLGRRRAVQAGRRRRTPSTSTAARRSRWSISTGTCADAPQHAAHRLRLAVRRGSRAPRIVTVEAARRARQTGRALARAAGVRERARQTCPPWTSFARFVTEGVWHIWHGYDHLAFVALLVLPIVLGRAARLARAPSVRRGDREIARVITAFTAAHSLTLALATLGVRQRADARRGGRRSRYRCWSPRC